MIPRHSKRAKKCQRARNGEKGAREWCRVNDTYDGIEQTSTERGKSEVKKVHVRKLSIEEGEARSLLRLACLRHFVHFRKHAERNS